MKVIKSKGLLYGGFALFCALNLGGILFNLISFFRTIDNTSMFGSILGYSNSGFIVRFILLELLMVIYKILRMGLFGMYTFTADKKRNKILFSIVDILFLLYAFLYYVLGFVIQYFYVQEVIYLVVTLITIVALLVAALFENMVARVCFCIAAGMELLATTYSLLRSVVQIISMFSYNASMVDVIPTVMTCILTLVTGLVTVVLLALWAFHVYTKEADIEYAD